MVSERAQLLHEKMSESPSSTLFSMPELRNLIHAQNDMELLKLGQELVDSKLVKLIKQGDDLKMQVVSVTEATKISNMSGDEAMVYQHIEASGREGIWTKTLKIKTNLNAIVVNRCLKVLENQRYIKSVKSVKHPTRKIYMLYNLQPSTDVTGGPWFTDSELDTEFIDSLLSLIWRFIASKTFPVAFQKPSGDVNLFQTSSNQWVALDSVMEFITVNQVTNIDLTKSDIRDLCDVLVFDDKLEQVKNHEDAFRATWQSVREAGFGKQWTEDVNSALVNQKLKQELLDQPFSIFDWYDAEPVGEPEDTIYLDAWAHS
ncbi:DNA-directed RNA polymerase III subunit RPC6 [Diutina catenulata]